MTEWQPILRQLEVAPLTRDEASAMRAAMLIESARRPTHLPGFASSGVVIASALAVVVTAGVVATRMSREVSRPAAPAVEGPSLRHLQFATPGGTRIIWQFDPDFTLRETIP